MDEKEKSRKLKAYLDKIAPGSLDKGSTNHSGFESFATRSAHELPSGSPADAMQGIDQLAAGEALDASASFELEAIIHQEHRPALLITDGRYRVSPGPWEHLADGGNRQRLEATIKAIGRIELPELSTIPYGGTAFVVAPDLIMTNRHVADIFVSGLGIKRLQFRPNASAAYNPYREHNGRHSDTENLQVVDILMIHPYWDMALLRVSGLDHSIPPLTLAATPIEEYIDSDIAVIGYPAKDPRNDAALQDRIFNGIYGVKRLQPGKLDPRRQVNSFENSVIAITHDASTLGGNSGSAIIDINTGKVLALHFAGRYLEANYAVPASELALDSRVVDAGVNFDKVTGTTHSWANRWQEVDEAEDNLLHNTGTATDTLNTTTQLQPVKTQTTTDNGTHTIRVTVPVTITVTVGTPVTSSEVISVTANAGVPTPSPTNDQSEALFGRSQPDDDLEERAYDRASVESLQSSENSLPAAITTAAASRLIYSDSAHFVENTLRSRMQFDDAVFKVVGNTEFAVATDEHTVLVAFRGTKGIQDWIGNMKVHSTTSQFGSVHYGFYQAFQNARFVLEHQLNAFEAKNKQVVITGHSLGGALATLAASEWRDTYSIRSVYTFGQPAVGKKDFAQSMAALSSRIYRYINDGDLITRIPPTYHHVGQKKSVSWSPVKPSGSASFESLSSAHEALTENIMSDADFELLQRSMSTSVQGAPMTEWIFSDMADHPMLRYLDCLMRLVPN